MKVATKATLVSVVDKTAITDSQGGQGMRTSERVATFRVSDKQGDVSLELEVDEDFMKAAARSFPRKWRVTIEAEP